MPSRYFEDFTPGDEWMLKPWTLTETEIIDFAQLYDPQSMHVDPALAATGPHGGVIASGWQTALSCITPFLREVMTETAGLASPGFDVFKWLKPVRPGQQITPKVGILETRVSTSKPDRGVVRLRFEGLEEDGTPVWEAEGVFLISCRETP